MSQSKSFSAVLFDLDGTLIEDLRLEEQTPFRAATQWEQRRIALISQGGEVSVMEMFGFDRPAPDDPKDDYDLMVLNFFVLLDALRQEDVSLRCRILAHWTTLQSLRASCGTKPLC